LIYTLIDLYSCIGYSLVVFFWLKRKLNVLRKEHIVDITLQVLKGLVPLIAVHGDERDMQSLVNSIVCQEKLLYKWPWEKFFNGQQITSYELAKLCKLDSSILHKMFCSKEQNIKVSWSLPGACAWGGTDREYLFTVVAPDIWSVSLKDTEYKNNPPTTGGTVDLKDWLE
jgi:hypothetical protein